VTAVANSVDIHNQSIGYGTAHSGTPSRVNSNLGCPVTLEVHTYVFYVVQDARMAQIFYVRFGRS
jgi:hypothetical protein